MVKEQTIDTETIVKLEEEMAGKLAEIAGVAKHLQEQSMKLPDEITKIGDAKGIKIVADAVKELQGEVNEQKGKIETALTGIQENMGSLKSLKAKAKTEDITEELKSILAAINDKQKSLKGAIKDVEVLRDKYTKQFFG